jgi:hypothetical protein
MKLHIFSSVLLVLEIFCIFVADLFLSVLKNTNTASQQQPLHVSDDLLTSMLPKSQTSLSKSNSQRLEQIFDTDGGNETLI